MKLEEFAQKIKTKYPEYQAIPDAELGQKMLAKYPQYISQIDKQEVPKKDIFQTIGSVINKVFPGKQVGEAIGTLAGAGIAKLKGTYDNYDLSAPTPFQVGGDVALGALNIAGAKLPIAGSVLGKTAQFGAIGGSAGGAKAISEGKTKEQVLIETGKGALIGAGTGLAMGGIEKVLTGVSKLAVKTADKIQTSVIKPSQADIKDGFSIDTIKKYNLGGSLKQTFEKTDKTLDSLSKQLNSKLESSNASIDLNKVYENTAKKLLGAKLESFGSNAQMEGAIEKLRNEIVAVSGDNGIVSIPEAQLVKRASGHFGAWSYGVPTPEATASQKVYNTFYNELKTAIEQNSPEGVKQINQEISKLIPVMNALIRRIPVAERNNALSLTDIISLTGASLDPRALSISLLNLASKSGRVGSLLSKTPDIGKAVQKVEPIARQAIAR